MPPSTLKGKEEHSLAVMLAGDTLGKYGRQGVMKTRKFTLSPSGKFLLYKGKVGYTQIPMNSVTHLNSGRDSAVFRSKDGDMYGTHPAKFQHLCTISFSLHYEEEDGSYRSLDLQCVGNEQANRSPEEQFVLWFHGLGMLVRLFLLLARCQEWREQMATRHENLSLASQSLSASTWLISHCDKEGRK
jgi:hypothetical protein